VSPIQLLSVILSLPVQHVSLVQLQPIKVPIHKKLWLPTQEDFLLNNMYIEQYSI
jgi:hypothetical protein